MKNRIKSLTCKNANEIFDTNHKLIIVFHVVPHDTQLCLYAVCDAMRTRCSRRVFYTPSNAIDISREFFKALFLLCAVLFVDLC